MGALGGLLRGLFSLVTALLGVAMLLRLFFVDLVTVPHDGMAPTLLVGETVAVWRKAQVDAGDIVVCPHPASPSASVLGRAVAFAGQRLRLDAQGNALLDDRHAVPTPTRTMPWFDAAHQKQITMQVSQSEGQGSGHYEHMVAGDAPLKPRSYAVKRGVFLLGDNRSDVRDDSRHFGEVEPGSCRGQVVLRVAPAQARPDQLQHSYFDVIP